MGLDRRQELAPSPRFADRPDQDQLGGRNLPLDVTPGAHQQVLALPPLDARHAHDDERIRPEPESRAQGRAVHTENARPLFFAPAIRDVAERAVPQFWERLPLPGNPGRNVDDDGVRRHFLNHPFQFRRQVCIGPLELVRRAADDHRLRQASPVPERLDHTVRLRILDEERRGLEGRDPAPRKPSAHFKPRGFGGDCARRPLGHPEPAGGDHLQRILAARQGRHRVPRREQEAVRLSRLVAQAMSGQNDVRFRRHVPAPRNPLVAARPRCRASGASTSGWGSRSAGPRRNPGPGP